LIPEQLAATAKVLNIAPEELKQLVTQADPTGEKADYAPWILRQWKYRYKKYQESPDVNRTKEMLRLFDNGKRFQIFTGDAAHIDNYRSFEALEQKIEEVGKAKLEYSKKDIKHEKGKEAALWLPGSYVIYKDENCILVRAETIDAIMANSRASGTFCTRGKYYANRYSMGGRLPEYYLYVRKNTELFKDMDEAEIDYKDYNDEYVFVLGISFASDGDPGDVEINDAENDMHYYGFPEWMYPALEKEFEDVIPYMSKSKQRAADRIARVDVRNRTDMMKIAGYFEEELEEVVDEYIRLYKEGEVSGEEAQEAIIDAIDDANGNTEVYKVFSSVFDGEYLWLHYGDDIEIATIDFSRSFEDIAARNCIEEYDIPGNFYVSWHDRDHTEGTIYLEVADDYRHPLSPDAFDIVAHIGEDSTADDWHSIWGSLYYEKYDKIYSEAEMYAWDYVADALPKQIEKMEEEIVDEYGEEAYEELQSLIGTSYVNEYYYSEDVGATVPIEEYTDYRNGPFLGIDVEHLAEYIVDHLPEYLEFYGVKMNVPAD